jgi:putative flippase GtrA
MTQTVRKVTVFLFVGSLGFAVDLGLLLLFVDMNISHYLARPLSMSAAITATWLLNRRLSFRASHMSIHREYVRYAAVTFGTAFINYMTYIFCLKMMSPAAAIAVGTLVPIAITYIGYDRWVFKPKA